MAGITALGSDEAAQLLAEWDLRLESLEALPERGTVNSNFRVRASGRTFFLRVNEGKRDEDAAAEAILVARLVSAGLPTPEPLKTRSGAFLGRAQGKPVTLFPWLDGHEAAPRPEAPATVAVAGTALGRLHLAGLDLGRERLPRNHYPLEELERRLGTFRDEARFAEIVPLLDEELERALRRPPTASGLIHQDLFPDNLLVDENGQLAAVLDLEQATFGRFAYDLAVSANAWCWDGQAIVRPAVEALLGAYEAVRALDPDERAAFPDECRLAAARFTITRITDVFLPENVDPDLRKRKDWRDYARRLHFWRS